MRFWRFWHSIKQGELKPLNTLKLIDISLLVVLLPLLLNFKLPMLLFAILVFALYIKAPLNSLSLTILTLIGLLAIFFSLYGSLSFIGLSRFSVFIELLSYLLFLAVSLQRLSGKLNFYLLISPILFLALSLFFYRDIAMLIYLPFVIFLFLWLLISAQIKQHPLESLRVSLFIFFLALPFVAILFLIVPRIGYSNADFGFKGEAIKRLGHDGIMRLDSGALDGLSSKIVMEIGFYKKGLPPPSMLYFRGSVLYQDMLNRWLPLPEWAKIQLHKSLITRHPLFKPSSKAQIVKYKVSLYPTFKRWIYMLELPYKIDANFKALINTDLEVKSFDSVDKNIIYDAYSILGDRFSFKENPIILGFALASSPSNNPKSAKVAKRIIERYPKNIGARVDAIINLFKSQKLTYTIHPPKFDLKHPADSFLFDKKKGYCVHFASAFVTLARLSKVPARIVTGYKGNIANSVNDNYLAIEERDAHAWCEVYINDTWFRIDPTAFASKIESTLYDNKRKKAEISLNGEALGEKSKINLYLHYIRFQIENWILRYDRYKQIELLNRLKNDKIFLATFISIAIALFALIVLIIYFIKNPPCSYEPKCLMRQLIKRLEKEGCIHQVGETLNRYLIRCSKSHPRGDKLKQIDELYHHLLFANEIDKERLLAKEIKKFLKESSKKRFRYTKD